MDAVNRGNQTTITDGAPDRGAGKKKYKIYFGGSYEEHWSEDYTLFVSYKNRRFVEACLIDGRWEAVGGDEALCALLSSADCPEATRRYFNAAAGAYSAAQDCLGGNLGLDRLYECFSAQGERFVAPELLRLLMDDCGFKLEDAYTVTARCCGSCTLTDEDAALLRPLQPRTASLIPVFNDAARRIPLIEHDGRREEYRNPPRAARCADELRFAFRLIRGSVRKAELILTGDGSRREYPMEQDGDVFSVKLTAPEKPAPLWYIFRLDTPSGDYYAGPDSSGFSCTVRPREWPGFRLTVYLRDFETPAWFRRSVMYQIFPDRFAFSQDGTAEKGIAYHKALGQTPELHKSLDEPVRWQPRSFELSYSPDDFYGGTFKGIEEKLPYLKELGISCIYLNPIVEARSNHRYDTANYLNADPILGTNGDFVRLCNKAQALGIRIMLDGVFSHTGADSVYFNRYGNYPGQGACQSKTSQYYDWYEFKSFPKKYRCWWGFEDLPEVDELNPRWQEFVVTGRDSVVKTWLRRGAAGWRLDVADELPDKALSLIRKAAKEEKPDAPILGEVWEDAVLKEGFGGRRNYALGYSLDSVMNYPFRTAVLDFCHRRISAYGLRDFLVGQQMNYPKPMYYALMNLIGSHDMERVRSALATDITIKNYSREDQVAMKFSAESLDRAVTLEKLCAAIQFAIPGVPSVYYGDEQGMCGVNDPFNRMPFKEGDRELHDCYVNLSAQRNASPILSTGEAEFAAVSQDVLTVLRYVNRGEDAFGLPCENGAYLLAVNRGEEAAEVEADCSAAGKGLVKLTVPPLSAKMFKL